MSLPSHPGLFATVERYCADLDPAPELRLAGGPDDEGVPLALRPARRLLYDRHADPAARAALWHQIAERRHLTSDRSDWPSAVVWLGLPGLRRAAFALRQNVRAERDDAEAELVTCYLEALAGLAPDTPDPGGHVLRSACTRAWARWRTVHRERAVDQPDRAGGRPLAPDPEGDWQADYDPPSHRSGLSAGLRFTVPAHRVEGVRIGALAQSWGLADTRYSGRGRQVASLALRRKGRHG